jgi:hypothetical protein
MPEKYADDKAVRVTEEDVKSDLGRIARQARERQYRSYALLGILAAVAGGSVAAGAYVDNPVFWGAAGSVFFMASAGLVAYAAQGLGIFSEALELIRTRSARAGNLVSAKPRNGPNVVRSKPTRKSSSSSTGLAVERKGPSQQGEAPRKRR